MAKRVVKRKIKIKGHETPAERQARTAVQFIMSNPHKNAILQIIRQGTPNSQIAAWGVSRGIFDVNQKTAVSYLQYFRKMHPELCKPVASDDDELGYLDSIFNGSVQVVDEETELLRLIALQKARLGIGFRNERQINLLMQSNNKEVEMLQDLIISLAKLRGSIKTHGDININYGDGVKDDLKSIQQDEHQRNVIASLVHDLVRA
jgi:hypothetical protein